MVQEINACSTELLAMYPKGWAHCCAATDDSDKASTIIVTLKEACLIEEIVVTGLSGPLEGLVAEVRHVVRLRIVSS